MSERFVVEVQETEQGDGFIEIPSKILNELGLEEGDTMLWEQLADGSGFYCVKK